MTMQQVLNGIGIDLVNEIVRGLGNHFKSGELVNSISYSVTPQGQIQIHMAPHWKYVEYGTPGRKQGVMSTVGGKTVSVPANPSRKLPVYKQGDKWLNYINQKESWALAKHIQAYGTKPYPFVRPALYNKLKEIVKKNMEMHYGST